MKKTIYSILIIVIIILAIIFFSKGSGEKIDLTQFDSTEEIILDDVVEEYEIQEAIHIAPGDEHGEYNSNPPSSGWHYASAPSWGTYKNEMPDEAAVHGLEHGGIWITYNNNASPEEIKLLEKFQKSNAGSTILSPREANNSKIILVSWGNVLRLDSVNTTAMQEFVDIYKNNSPEPFAR